MPPRRKELERFEAVGICWGQEGAATEEERGNGVSWPATAVLRRVGWSEDCGGGCRRAGGHSLRTCRCTAVAVPTPRSHHPRPSRVPSPLQPCRPAGGQGSLGSTASSKPGALTRRICLCMLDHLPCQPVGHHYRGEAGEGQRAGERQHQRADVGQANREFQDLPRGYGRGRFVRGVEEWGWRGMQASGQQAERGRHAGRM